MILYIYIEISLESECSDFYQTIIFQLTRKEVNEILSKDNNEKRKIHKWQILQFQLYSFEPQFIEIPK